jgi:hypothetical protein
MRELEELDLVHFEGGRLRGPHAILDDSLRQLIPGSVAALLHARIAESLAKECVAEGYSLSLAWAAVQSWLAAGEPQAAVNLACQCAREAALLGEPQTGAELLGRIPRICLPVDSKRQLLDDLFELAQAGNLGSLGMEALHERLQLAVQSGEGHRATTTIKLNTMAYELQNGAYDINSIAHIEEILHDATLSLQTRLEAGKRLLAFADAEFEPSLAIKTYNYLCELCGTAREDDPTFLKAALIFHTTFGDADHAIAVGDKALTLFSTSLFDGSKAFLSNTGLALLRLGYYAAARDIGIRIFEHTFAKGILTGAEYALTIIAEAEICLGNFASAERWLDRWQSLAERRSKYESRFCAGYFSSKLQLAVHAERFIEAEGYLASYRDYGLNVSPRYKAVELSHSIILRYRRGDALLPEKDVSNLWSLYDRGKTYCGQDSQVEALWCHLMMRDEPEAASRLLGDYLNKYRRERPLPEASLCRVTAADPAWLSSPHSYYLRVTR